jgi:hypothetical protein
MGGSRFLHNSVTMMQVMARACGHNLFNLFSNPDMESRKQEMNATTELPWGDNVGFAVFRIF